MQEPFYDHITFHRNLVSAKLAIIAIHGHLIHKSNETYPWFPIWRNLKPPSAVSRVEVWIHSSLFPDARVIAYIFDGTSLFSSQMEDGKYLPRASMSSFFVCE